MRPLPKRIELAAYWRKERIRQVLNVWSTPAEAGTHFIDQLKLWVELASYVKHISYSQLTFQEDQFCVLLFMYNQCNTSTRHRYKWCLFSGTGTSSLTKPIATLNVLVQWAVE